jgi:magnesium transporter
MVLDLKFSIGTLGMGSGAFIAALYGMNLKNFIEESDFGFLGITGWSFILSALVCTYGLTKLRKVQRVSMWGEGGRRGRNWRDEDLDRALGQREHEAERVRHQERARKMKELKLLAMEEMKRQQVKQRHDAAVARAHERGQKDV